MQYTPRRQSKPVGGVARLLARSLARVHCILDGCIQVFPVAIWFGLAMTLCHRIASHRIDEDRRRLSAPAATKYTCILQTQLALFLSHCGWKIHRRERYFAFSLSLSLSRSGSDIMHSGAALVGGRASQRPDRCLLSGHALFSTFFFRPTLLLLLLLLLLPLPVLFASLFLFLPFLNCHYTSSCFFSVFGFFGFFCFVFLFFFFCYFGILNNVVKSENEFVR